VRPGWYWPGWQLSDQTHRSRSAGTLATNSSFPTAKAAPIFGGIGVHPFENGNSAAFPHRSAGIEQRPAITLAER